jgi:predicted nucleic acid-binding protein
MIVVDTSVLSHVWRRSSRKEDVAAHFLGLVQGSKRLAIPGIVLQELLGHTRTDEQMERLDRLSRPYLLLLADRDVHVLAASVATSCARAGAGVGAVDCLVAAHTLAVDGQLFTLDDDFKHIAKHTGLRLYVM